MSTWSLINRDDLQYAANTAAFDTLLPVLIRRLIAETSGGLSFLDMPGWSGVAMPGFDGIVKATESSPFVPEGASVWELSVSGGNSKANQDYDKRELAPEGLRTKDVTYVQVLLEPWTKMREWQEDRNNEGRWRNVIAYNVDSINAWLDTAPATEIWLADQLGKPHTGVCSLETWWQDVWKSSTKIPLDESFVLAGRTEQADLLIRKLSSGKQFISVGGNLRAEELQAFVAAVVASTPDLNGLELWARTVTVSEATTLKLLLACQQPLIIVLEHPLLVKGISPGIHTVIAQAPAGGDGDIKVPRIDDQRVITLLQENGKTLSEASQLGILGRRSFLAMRRALAIEPNLHTPIWAYQVNPLMRKLMLIGSWNETVTSDVDLLERYTNRAYDDFRHELETLELANDIPFIGYVEGIRYVVAIQDAWTLLENSLTRNDLDHFASLALEVLGEPQPAVEEPVIASQHYAQLHLRNQYSFELRKGVAETLALMGSRGVVIAGAGGQTTETLARRIVRDILNTVSYDKSTSSWTSLDDVLLYLAEAAPRDFLDAVNTEVRECAAQQFVPFSTEPSSLLGIAHSTVPPSILAALSMLAWIPDFIDEATGVMALLTEYEWERTGTSQAYEALVATVNIGAPQTFATVEDRIRCIRTIVKRYPRVGSRLIGVLLPDHYTFVVPPKPRYREWTGTRHNDSSALEQGSIAYIELLTNDYGQDVDSLKAAVDKIEVFPPSLADRFLSHLGDVALSLTEAEKTLIYDSLREKIVNYAHAPSLVRAPGETRLQRLQEIRDGLAPQDPTRKYGWLFREAYVPLEEVSFSEASDEYETLLESKRVTALKEVLTENGIIGVVRLAELSWSANIVGYLLAEVSTEYDGVMVFWLGGRKRTVTRVASGYLGRRLQQSGDSLAQVLITKTEEPLIKARIISLIGDYQTEQEYLSSLDKPVTEAYWSEFHYLNRGASFPYVLEVAHAMEEAGRPIETLHMMALYLGKQEFGLDAAELIVSAFEKFLSMDERDTEHADLNQSNYIKLFDFVAQYRDSIGLYRLLNLEWQLCPTRGLKSTMPAFHRALVKHPEIFVALVLATMDITAEDAAIGEILKPSRQAPSIPGRAWSVLFTCEFCPGVDEGGNLDSNDLESWIITARSRFANALRTDRGDIAIGKILSNAPPTDDGAPLDEPVRNLLEKFANTQIDEGVRTGIINARGVVSQGIYEGGSKDQNMAERFDSYAKSSQAWPRTRKIFEDVASSYRFDAYQGDSQSEQLRHGFMFY